MKPKGHQQKQRRQGPRPAKGPECVANYGVWFLSKFGDTSEKNLRTKMRNKTDNESWIDAAIQKLIDLDYQSDERFAELIVRRGLESKSWGHARIEAEMVRKGVPSEVAKEALVALQDDDPAERATDALAKKFRLRELVEQKDRGRATRYLASRGFDFQSISVAIARHNGEISRAGQEP